MRRNSNAALDCLIAPSTEILISADRSNKASLLLAIPRSLFKSSAKDFALEKLDFDRFSAWGRGMRRRHVVRQEARQVVPLFVFA